MESAYQATFKLSELQDDYSADRLEETMMEIEGVHKVSIAIEDSELTVVYEDDKVKVEDLKDAASSTGCTIEQVKK